MREKINPVGLKGNQITERMKQLMGVQPINENKKNSVVELTKKGPDGKVYGIVRENHEYYIKVTTKQENLVVEDFQYIGGLQNKKQEVYPSYAKAIKHLNLKFHSLNESLGKNGNFNVFLDDKLMKEDWAGFAEMSGPMFKAEGNMEGHMRSECCNAQTMEGMCMECGGPAYGMMDEKKYSDDASDFISKEISHLMKDKGYSQDRAIAAALSVAREKGYKVPEKSDEGKINIENEGVEPNDDNLPAIDRMYNSDEWVDAQRDAMGYTNNDDEELTPEMEAVHGMMEKELSDKQKRIAAMAGDPNKIDANDLAALRAGKMHKKNEGKLSIERALSMMDEMIDELHESQSKKKI